MWPTFVLQASRELSEARAEQSIVSATKVALEDRLDRTPCAHR